MAKTRLSGLLSPSERRALAQAMAQDVLAVLAAHPRIHRTVLVSDDPAAELLTAPHSMEAWSETSLGATGLNGVLQEACERVAGVGAGTALILHADLPLLDASDIDTVLDEQARTGGLVIGTDHESAGTNMLAFDASQPPQFKFGVNSRRRHESDALEMHKPVTVLQSVGLSTDVDEIKDLLTYMQHDTHDPERKTARFLRSSPIATRLSMAYTEEDPMGGQAGDGEVSGHSSNNIAPSSTFSGSHARIEAGRHAQSGSDKDTGKSG